jgi:hypothetical protein
MQRFSILVMSDVLRMDPATGRPVKGMPVTFEQPRYHAETMIQHGRQLIEAIGTCQTPIIVVSERVIIDLSSKLGLNSAFDMVQVDDVVEQANILTPDMANGIRFIASLLQMADHTYLRPAPNTVSPVVQMRVARKNNQFLLRPKRRPVEPESAVASMMCGNMSMSN